MYSKLVQKGWTVITLVSYTMNDFLRLVKAAKRRSVSLFRRTVRNRHFT